LRYFSTKDKTTGVSFEHAIFHGLPADNGLYVPESVPQLDSEWVNQIEQSNLQEIGFQIARPFVGTEISESALAEIIHKAIDFPAPVVTLDDQNGILELFHGPSLAFKDFGARFMAATMSHFLKKKSRETTILVATSGDTGGAVAYGFLGVPGIKVVILYPSGKVSDLQEKQLTTLGQNVRALEVSGTFDDCQAMVKQAFLDEGLRTKMHLSSANSINIARLIPQAFYYADAYRQIKPLGKDLVFSVPSGNFGNITAGLYAQAMGIPIKHFIASTNANQVFPDYLKTGNYDPKPSISTLSNAMDVGNPSNFYRILDLFGSTWNTIREHVSSYHISDEDTLHTMQEVYQRHQYTLDPHTAVGFFAANKWRNEQQSKALILTAETAHPSKFLDVMAMAGIKNVEVPERLKTLSTREKVSVKIGTNYAELKEYLLG
jgi:threonine synthase